MTIPCCCLAFVLLVASSPVLASSALSEGDIADRGLLACFTEYCDAFELGEIPTKEAIDRISDKDAREVKARELAKVHAAFSALRILTEHLQASDLPVDERCEVLRQLARLQSKSISARRIGVGNMELASVVSLLMSGVFFQVYGDIDDTARRDLLALFTSCHTLSSGQVLRSALVLEGRSFPMQGSSPHGSSIQLALQGGLPNLINSSKVAVLDTLAKELQSKPGAGKVLQLLNELDEQWLAWDLLWAVRLRALCTLSEHIPTAQAGSPAEAARQFKTFEAAVSALSDAERESINAKFTPLKSKMKRIAYIMLEVQERVADKGKHILAMVSHRLKPDA